MVATLTQQKKPRALREGSRIAVVSPSSPVTPEKLELGLKKLEGLRFEFEVFPSALHEIDYLAGKDEDRAADLMRAFQDPAYDGVYCTRGGYGAARLLPMLDFDAMAESKKAFIGFSDITTLHIPLNRRGLVTFYGPMALSFAYDRSDWVLPSFGAAISGSDPVPPDTPAGNTLVSGSAEGVVTGGCLCLITDSLGTPESIDLEGKIVLIEDVDEAPHRVDAMLTHLLNAGQLQKAAGIVISEMTNTDQKEDITIGMRSWRDIVKDRIIPLGKPAIVDFPFGHIKGMLTLPLGIRARLDADQGTLTYLESACEG